MEAMRYKARFKLYNDELYGPNNTHNCQQWDFEKAIYPFRSTLSLLNYHRCMSAFVWVGMYMDVDMVEKQVLSKVSKNNY